MPDRSLITVRTELVVETLVGSMHEAALQRAEDGEDRLRQLGWHARALELERFAPARAAMPWLAELLEDRDAASVCAELAAAEPVDRPDPGEAPSWRVPGPGGHVRHYLALRAAEASGVADPGEGKRRWMAGFFAHCCEETVSRPPAASP